MRRQIFRRAAASRPKPDPTAASPTDRLAEQAPALPIGPKDAAVIGSAFILSMAAEALVLKDRPKRAFGDLDDATLEELADRSLPPDPLVPVGYERRDTTASLTMLAGNLVVNAAVLGLTSRIDRWVYRHRIANLGSTKHGFAAAMLTWDFLYYWDHRWMHEVRLFWANHVSHHSSERYNLSTALRQPWSGILTHWVYLPMPLLGFSPAMTSKAGLYNLLYQYWVHTEAIDRLPAPVEAVMNTASHHRAHHGVNPQYLDKNYAGIFIFWDKLFGTFEPEVRRVKYGLTKNIDTYNPVQIGYHEFADIVRDVRSAEGLRNKLRHVFGRPGWSPSRRGDAPGSATVTTAA